MLIAQGSENPAHGTVRRPDIKKKLVVVGDGGMSMGFAQMLCSDITQSS